MSHDPHLRYRDARPPTDERIPLYGWDPCRMMNLTYNQLHELRHRIEINPANWTTGGIYLFTPKARKKLDAIAWCITYKMKEDRDVLRPAQLS